MLSRFIIQCKKKIPFVNIIIHFFRKICESWDCGNAFFFNSSFCLKDGLFIIGNNYCQSPLNRFGKMFPNLNSRLNNHSGSFKMILITKRSRRWRGERAEGFVFCLLVAHLCFDTGFHGCSPNWLWANGSPASVSQLLGPYMRTPVLIFISASNPSNCTVLALKTTFKLRHTVKLIYAAFTFCCIEY